MLCLLSAAATAQGLGDRLFDSKQACFARVYAQDHLDRHPVQQVTHITLRPDLAAMVMGGESDVVTVSLQLRGDREIYFGSAYCNRTGAALTCYLDGDAGSFKLTEAANGALRLEVGPNGMNFERSSDFASLWPDRGDDRVFLLPPVLCPG